MSAAAAKSHQLGRTLCDPIDSSPLGSPVPGILQARTLEWVAISFSSAQKWKVKVKSLSCVRLFETHGLQPTRLLHPWDFPGKSTGVGCHCLLQFKPWWPQSQMFWWLIFLVQDTQALEPSVSSDPSVLGENVYNCNILLIVHCLPRDMAVDYIMYLPLPSVSWFFFYTFSCGKSFLLLLR